MPYKVKKEGKKYCVYKKEDNTKVGCTTKEKLNGYLAALHMHEPKNNFNKMKYIQNFSEGDSEANILLYNHIGIIQDDDGNTIYGINGEEFACNIQYLEECGVEKVNIRINSPGGSVIDGWSIISAIKNTKMEVHTYNDGLAASISGIIFCCGDCRYAMDYSITMIHNPSGLDEKDILAKVKDSLITILKNNSYISDEQLDKLMNEETYLNADETLESGLCDIILNSGEKPEDDVENMNVYEMVNTFNKIINKMKNKTQTVEELKSFKKVKNKTSKNKLGVESPETLTNKKKAKDDDEFAVDEEGLMNDEKTSFKKSKSKVKESTKDIFDEEGLMDDESMEEEDPFETEKEKLAKEDNPKYDDSDEDQDGNEEEQDDDDMKSAYDDLMEKHKKLMADHEEMKSERDDLKGKLEKMKDEVRKEHKKKIDEMVNSLFISGKIGKSEIDSITALAEKDFDSVKNLFSKVGLTKNVTFKEVINEKSTSGLDPKWTIRDYEKKDPGKLMEIKNNLPTVYAQLYKDFYGVEPKK